MKLRPFELALVIIFAVSGAIALAVVAGYNGGGGSNSDGPVIGAVQIWGTLPEEAVVSVIDKYKETGDAFKDVMYDYVPPGDFNSRLINALADGRGPDIILTSHELLVETRGRIAPYTYEQLPPPDIRSRYVDGAQIYGLSDGFYALPVAVDPLVLYWNRDILATDGYLLAPRTWEELINIQFPDLIERDFDRTIERGVVAMGEYANVQHAFGLVSMLLVQAGTQGVVESGGRYEIRLRESVGSGDPLRTVADFYTRFSKPSNSLYSWNRSFASDRAEFVGENLSFYFAPLSEASTIQRLNPNLNFDIAEVPQGETATNRRTYGEFYGLSILRSTDNVSGSYAVMAELGSTATADQIAINAGMSPAARSSVAQGSNTTFGRVGYQSAAISYGWLNPNRSGADTIFATMMSDINENRRSVTSAASDAVGRLERAY